jgi:hypothetical protein
LQSIAEELSASAYLQLGVNTKKITFAYYGLIIYFCTYKQKTMDTKLTLKLDKFVIEQAKEYASSHKRSLSRIIESYLRSLVNRDKNDEESNFEISPFVKSMSTGVNIPFDLDYKSEILNHLIEKHK